ncbi:hypothetical protein COMA2_40099 [Candidatus Nitrospira nitrificans]|uniref:Uncharacterized protein n=1 Tax=Candidatus Nitrospira nitrificans TaxID=1742973 RepID=A0A0S4LPR4_9BACT|nr:hypothetical protein COMA2_40099 [Candidatus Nitrospira nitrificans]
MTERPNVPVLKTDLDPQEPPKTA